ncbi:MAG: DNA-processing protein DprA [Alphaproteobacteria bacterium]|nr:DNA-processing protein DprA [Alphaproteobacteria bacterium]
MLEPAERTARLQLARTDGIGPITFKRLLDRFQSARRTLEALPDMAKRGGRAKPFTPYTQAAAEDEIAKLNKLGGTLVVMGDEGYPSHLAAIDDAPMVLSVIGNASMLLQSGIAIVGSRNASLQGRRFAETLAADLGRAGLSVISGLARGIDTAAHGASLTTGTVAVVAGGVDVIYPAENKGLYETISQKGCIVAENPLGMQPLAQHFPRRNRIISGLSQGVVIVEANTKSGSLITATMAADQGREVFAVPGHPFDPRAAGPNSLIRDGATLVTSAHDILDAIARRKTLRVVRETANTQPFFPGAEPESHTVDSAREALCNLMGATPVGVDDLIREAGIPAPVINIALLELELAGRIVRHPQNRVSMPFSAEGMDRSTSFL